MLRIMKIKNILLSGILALSFTAASAQEETKTEYVFNPHWYLQLQGGAQYTLGETSFGDLISPNIQVGVGYEFNKVVGARLSINAWKSKGGLDERTYEYDYEWKYVAPMLEATFNLSNLFCDYNPKRLVNVGLFAGIGMNIGFDNDEAEELANTEGLSDYFGYLWEDDTEVRFVGRIGANVDFRLSDVVSLGIEVNASTLNDHYNSKKAGNPDWYFNGLIGLKFNLGKTYTTREIPAAPKPVERVIERVVEKPAPAPVVEQPKPAPQEKIRREIFFVLRGSEIDAEGMKKIDDIVRFMQDHPEATVDVTGYADKGTGNEKINEGYAQKRADAVAKVLNEKGIAKDRMNVTSKGSREQPFSENNKNRVTICVAE